MYYYAQVDDKDVVINVSESEFQINDYYFIAIDSVNQSLIGLWYDRSDNTFKEQPISVQARYSTDQINYRTQNVWLSDVLDGKAEEDHTHDYLPLNGGTMNGNINGGKHSINNLTSIELSPSASSNNGGFIDFHYNGSSSDYTSRIIEGSEGKLTVEGDLNVNGVVRCNGSQVFYINDTNAVIGSANATGLVTLAAGSSATMVANGANFSAPNIIPRNNGTNFSIGSSSAPFKYIYLQNNPVVSSDSRLKEGIQQLPVDELADFIKGIKLVKYNYIGDDKERIGVIAQQLQEVNPELAKYFVNEQESGYLGLSVADLVFPLIAAVRSLQQRVEELEKGVK